MPAAPDQRWISPLECSRRLGLHVQSIYKKMGRGELVYGRIGRVLRIDWLAVEKDLESQGQTTKARTR